MLQCDKNARLELAFQGKTVADNRTMGQPERSPRVCATVIVPAHNEAAGIEANLANIVEAIGGTPREGSDAAIGLIVVCNGCTDGTAAIAARVAPGAMVVELNARGKAGAINLAMASAPPGPVIVTDADIAPGADVLAALLAVLAGDGILAASPAARFVLPQASPAVRAYFRVFAQHPYLTEGVGGSGVYGLSAAGRRALGGFPPIAADDQYVRRLFPLSAQRRVTCDADGRPVFVAVHPPATLAELLRTEIRSRNGDRVAGALCPARPQAARPWMWAAFRSAPLDFAMFAAIKLLARLLMPLSRSGRAEGWTPAR
jgi:hypothetical protein